jgi:hypothetical protein
VERQRRVENNSGNTHIVATATLAAWRAGKACSSWQLVDLFPVTSRIQVAEKVEVLLGFSFLNPLS